MSIEAMKQGLAAVEVLEKIFREAETMGLGPVPTTGCISCQITADDLRIGLNAAPALRQAIEQSDVTYEIYQNDEWQAGSNNFDEAMRYAYIYGEDANVEMYEVTRRKIA